MPIRENSMPGQAIHSDVHPSPPDVAYEGVNLRLDQLLERTEQIVTIASRCRETLRDRLEGPCAEKNVGQAHPVPQPMGIVPKLEHLGHQIEVLADQLLAMTGTVEREL